MVLFRGKEAKYVMPQTKFNWDVDQQPATVSWQILYNKAKVEHEEQ